MNDMHDRFRIANEDMLYVLSTFVFEPIRWIERFGYRPMTEHEKTAWFHYYRELGQHIGIADIPADRAGLEAVNRQVEATRFRHAESNHRIGSVTRDLLLGFYIPRRLFRLGRPVAHAFMDAPLLRAMLLGMRLRRAILRVLPTRRRPRLLTQVRRPSYPGGYRVEELGTFCPTGARRREEDLS